MQQSKKSAGRIALSLLLAVCMLGLFGCAERTVRALDYSLENELISGDQEQTQQTDEPVTSPESPTQAITQTPSPAEPAATPAPEQTSDGEPFATPELHCLRVIVQSQTNTALAGARVTLYQDGAVLFSELTGSDGSVSWMLPPGYQYRVKAQLSGYYDADGDGSCDMAQDALVKLTLVKSGGAGDGTATPTPQPVPEGAPGKVTITAADISIQPNQDGFSLLDGVRALTEFGEQVAVWVVDNGGFAIAKSGAYTVTYGAFEEGKLITVKRTVTVEGVSEDEFPEDQAQAPSGSSRERYEILVDYKAKVGVQLSERVNALNEAYQQAIDEALAQNEGARLLAAADVENDTDSMTSSATDLQQAQNVKVTNWPDVLATFLAQNVGSEVRPLNAEELANIPLEKLDRVFWDMNTIDVFRMDGTANVLIGVKSYEDMAADYGMSAGRKSFLYELMQPEFLRTFASITGNNEFSDASKESVETLLETLPDETTLERKQVVETALSLVGKVSYVLGDKYSHVGWNDAWGNANDAQAGEPIKISQKKGLDCSGFVSWVFINATQDVEAARIIGNGTRAQWKFSTAVGWDEGRPGDLVFYYAPGERQYNHVGIIVSCDADGSYLVAHCSSRQNGVVVTDGWSTGFRYIRRPAFFK